MRINPSGDGEVIPRTIKAISSFQVVMIGCLRRGLNLCFTVVTSIKKLDSLIKAFLA